MAQEIWTAVDDYTNDVMVRSDEVLDQALIRSNTAGLRPINVAPNQGKMLQIYARMIGARRILEIGTLGGYSTIWLARALPADGTLITLEIDPRNAGIARENITFAGLMDKVEIRVGKADDSLATMHAERVAPFDFIFIDADKPSNPDYFSWAMKLIRAGGLILIDNVVRNGAVADPASQDADVLGVRRMNELIAQTKGISATSIQTVGAKGYDGFTLVLVD